MANFIYVSSKIKVITFIVLYFSFSLNSVIGQGLKNFVNEHQVGFEGAFGMKSFQVSSNIAEINNLHVVGEGGSIGVLAGSKSIVVRIKQGYYFSNSSVSYTVNEVRSSALMNFYPLYFFRPNASLRPYFIAGLERNIFEMHGYYDHGQDAAQRNYSLSEAPTLGKISSILTAFGGGMEYRIKKPGYFVSFFGEARYGKSLKMNSSNELFAKTTLSGQLATSIGIAFGYYR